MTKEEKKVIEFLLDKKLLQKGDTHFIITSSSEYYNLNNIIQEYADQQTEALKKEVEALMSTINKLSGGTLSGILEEEITQLKKQLKEREEDNEKYAEEKALELIDSFLRSGEGLGDKGMLYKEIQYRRTQFTNQINK